MGFPVPRQALHSLLASSLMAGCAKAPIERLTPMLDCGESPPVNETTITDCIRANGDPFMKNRLARDPFDSTTRFDPGRSRFQPADADCLEHNEARGPIPKSPHFFVVYVFHDPQAPFVNVTFQVGLDLHGQYLDGDAARVEFPDCRTRPRERKFPITQAMAAEPARTGGLEAAIKAWELDFFWLGENEVRLQTFVWGIRSTTSEGGEGWGYHAEGRSARADANSGELLDLHEWFAQS